MWTVRQLIRECFVIWWVSARSESNYHHRDYTKAGVSDLIGFDLEREIYSCSLLGSHSNILTAFWWTKRKFNDLDESRLLVVHAFPLLSLYSTRTSWFTFRCKLWAYGDLSLRIFASSSWSFILTRHFFVLQLTLSPEFNWSISIETESKSNNEWTYTSEAQRS